MTATSTQNCVFSQAKYWDGAELINLATSSAPAGANFQYEQLTCTSTIQIGESTSGLPYVVNGFTHGEVLANLWGFLIFVAVAYTFIHFHIRGIKIRQ